MARRLTEATARLTRIRKRQLLGGALIVLSLGLVGWSYGRLYAKRWVLAADIDARRTTGAASDAGWLRFRGSPLPDEPVSGEFGLVVPALKLNVPIIKDVSGIEGREYFTKLKRGVAHQAGTPTPDQGGNTVLFGHSSTVPGVTPSPYDEAFLLLDKLQPGDPIYLYYGKLRHTYTVSSITRVAPGDLHILDNTPEAKVTLYTCWPPGTDAQRLVVSATAQ